jgi:hypothetical protein
MASCLSAFGLEVNAAIDERRGFLVCEDDRHDFTIRARAERRKRPSGRTGSSDVRPVARGRRERSGSGQDVPRQPSAADSRGSLASPLRRSRRRRPVRVFVGEAVRADFGLTVASAAHQHRWHAVRLWLERDLPAELAVAVFLGQDERGGGSGPRFLVAGDVEGVAAGASCPTSTSGRAT